MSKSTRSPQAHMAPRIDATNLAGITTLMNPQHVKIGIKLDDAEKSVMGKSMNSVKKSDGDPVRIYAAELNQLAEELGIDLLDEDTAPQQRPIMPTTASTLGMSTNNRVASLIDDIDLENKSASEECDCNSDCPDDCDCECHEECDCDSNCPDDCDCECHDESSNSGSHDESSNSGGSHDESSNSGSSKSGSSTANVDRIISKLEGDLGIKTDGKRERRHNRIHGGTSIPKLERHKSNNITQEQEKRRHINSIVADIRGETRTTFGVERERIQDIKASKLEQIGQLRMTLEEEGIDCNSVSNPSSESPIEEIDSVLNILRLKNDRNRYSSLAEEVILGVAEGIETVFDGSRTVPLVGWRPDYTGYHNTVNVKLHRMRFETSQVVGNIIEKYNVGPSARIVMELLPSFFLYPRQQQKQRGAPGLSNDPHISDARNAMGSIRASDERQTLDDVRRL